MSGVYLDHNSTTLLDPRVLEVMLPFLRGQHGNPSSSHQAGRAAHAAIECARAQLALLVNADPQQVIFTGSGTEANNLALRGALAYCPPGRLAVSVIEHASLLSPARSLGRQGWHLHSIPVDHQGRVTPEVLRAALHPDIRLASVMWANNETGVIQDIAGLAAVVRGHGALFHTDAVQALGKIPIDFAVSGAHLMSLSAHKMGGPQGIAALIKADSVELQALLQGGSQERGLRAGTENVAAIAGFGAAAALAAVELQQRQAHWSALRARLETGLRGMAGNVILAEQAERLPNTVLVSVPEFAGETLLSSLDRAGFMLSSGSACASGSLSPSHVLVAMAVEQRLMRNVLRISMGTTTTHEDIGQFLTELRRLLRQFAPWPTLAMH